MTDVLVLYEDSRAANGRFGPHDLLLGCVGDDRGETVVSLAKRVVAYPIRGAGNLKKAIADLSRFDNLIAGGPIVAVFDSDQLHRTFPDLLHSSVTTVEIEKKIEGFCSSPSRLTVVLLEQNLETVINAIKECGDQSTDLIRQALQKRLNARDTLLGRVGHDGNRRLLRQCIRRLVPSFDRLVGRVVELLPE